MFRSDKLYTRLGHVGEGTHGVVYKAIAPDNSIVVLKRIPIDKKREGFPITAIREIAILQSLEHPNVIPLVDVVHSENAHEDGEDPAVFLVYPYMDHDLTGLLDSQNNKFEPAQVKYYMICLLRALEYLHRHRILHRDIKGSNILLSNNGDVRLSDFGLARWECPRNPRYTNRMITLWYRPLELLYGVENYDQSADVWSAGCIFAELLSGNSPFPGKSELDQIEKIFKVCGTPNLEDWPQFQELPWYNFLKPKADNEGQLKEMFGVYGREAYDLLSKMLALNPSKRITAKEALDHEYFKTEPLPWNPKDHPEYNHSHSWDAKLRRIEARKAGKGKESESGTSRKGGAQPDTSGIDFEELTISLPPPPKQASSAKKPRSPSLERKTDHRISDHTDFKSKSEYKRGGNESKSYEHSKPSGLRSRDKRRDDEKPSERDSERDRRMNDSRRNDQRRSSSRNRKRRSVSRSYDRDRYNKRTRNEEEYTSSQSQRSRYDQSSRDYRRSRSRDRRRSRSRSRHDRKGYSRSRDDRRDRSRSRRRDYSRERRPRNDDYYERRNRDRDYSSRRDSRDRDSRRYSSDRSYSRDRNYNRNRRSNSRRYSRSRSRSYRRR